MKNIIPIQQGLAELLKKAGCIKVNPSPEDVVLAIVKIGLMRRMSCADIDRPDWRSFYKVMFSEESRHADEKDKFDLDSVEYKLIIEGFKRLFSLREGESGRQDTDRRVAGVLFSGKECLIHITRGYYDNYDTWRITYSPFIQVDLDVGKVKEKNHFSREDKIIYQI